MKKLNLRLKFLMVVMLSITMIVTGCLDTTVKKPAGDTTETSSSTGEVITETPEPSAIKDPENDAKILAFITQKSNNPDKIVIRYSSTTRNFDDHPQERGNREFFRSLKEQLGDKVEIRPYFNGALGSTTDAMLGGVVNRSFEFGSFALGSFAELTNAFNPLDVPYLFSDIDDAYEKVMGPMGDLMREKCIDDTGIRVTGIQTIGMRHVTNGKHTIKTPADLDGVKIRTQMNPLHIALIEAWGTSSTPVAYTELYTALQQGVTDGQENPIVNMYDAKFYEVQKHMTFTNHLSTFAGIVCNEEWYREQSDEVKAAIDKAAKDGEEMAFESVKLAEESALEGLDEYLEIYYPTADEHEVFVESAKKMWPQAEEYIGSDYFLKVLEAGGIEW